ncbi:DeoR/GlpR family DNA-binding transcription regulator [Telmatospirillum sp.]|uniref:DeoR/GlpR family DNA-binding transcription regulator n=1 Tax=Telmatospirillum sp. TaxID=2079197 RepID=UPI00284DB122|nr:DeoR/GlpR family DNA-binding transcription regulator [Telmatospirillum sp.]MDR3436210.1 DeoR/GlpR family DNA-binding transcription regulator [Telmatospirillum sp.]
MKIDRVSAIRHYLFSRTSASVHEIAEVVGASLPTVRRDLLALEAEGSIERTHGGARIADTAGVEAAFEVREQTHIAAKRAIGFAAYGLIEPETAVFLDAGTTVLQVARQLRLAPMPLSVFTNCLPVAQMLADVRDIEVTLLGGRMRSRNASILGSFAEAMLDRLWFDRLFLGASAIGDDGWTYTPDEDEAHLNGKMLSRAATTSVLADASKFGSRATYRVVEFDSRVDLITDERLEPEWQTRLAKKGCAVTLVPVDSVAPTDEEAA